MDEGSRYIAKAYFLFVSRARAWRVMLLRKKEEFLDFCQVFLVNEIFIEKNIG